jgi:hypothetical protein
VNRDPDTTIEAAIDIAGRDFSSRNVLVFTGDPTARIE